ncbi:sororin [Oryzias latipes]|uniref:Cell division cycle associated 5 n=1 Tax=Oryzias latipes TaxID=8090 RepID=H2M1F1_ORYLA|nr:sororin [Oryzias latipes]
MKEGETHSVMVESNRHIDPPRRRSPRLSSTLQPPGKIDTNMAALEAVPVKRSITLRKIAPRKTVTSAEQDKENTPRRTSNRLGQKKEVSTPDLVPDRRASAISSAKKKKQASMPSPILPSSPPTSNPAEKPPATPEDAEWARKVRRSYSRLSDKSLHSPDSRDTLFGFQHLQTPEVNRAAGQSRSALELSSISALNSFTSLLDTDAGGAAEPDPNIPGVAVVKERKRRRKKVAPIDGVELDVLVAQMNAEFQEAEEFELVVE